MLKYRRKYLEMVTENITELLMSSLNGPEINLFKKLTPLLKGGRRKFTP